AFSDDVLADHDAVALAELIRGGELGVREVVEAAIARAESVDGALQAIHFDAFEQARQRAGGFRSGTFAGVPTFVKDNIDIRGLPTCFGSEAVGGRLAAKDGAFARQYLSQGLVCLGKSAMPEFGFNATTEWK